MSDMNHFLIYICSFVENVYSRMDTSIFQKIQAAVLDDEK